MLDLAVIGGGPAGTSAALQARRRGLEVAVWERNHFPRHKVCGEFISAEALPWLQQEVFPTLARSSSIHHAEFVSANGFRRGFNLPQSARGLSRYLLDASLWKAAADAGVEVHEAEGIRSVRKLGGRGDRDIWELESSGKPIAKAKALIVACGRWWKIEGLPSPARGQKLTGIDEWIGTKAHFAGLELRACVEMFLFQGGYCGLAPIEDGKYNACCLVRRERLRDAGMSGVGNFPAWLERVFYHPALKARLHGATQISTTVTTAPVRLSHGSSAEDGALLAGDSSGFLDPFTGEGISMALHSGRLAGDAIAECLAGGLGRNRAVEVYRQSLSRAVQQSYTIAGVARTLIHAPRWVQNLSAVSLPWLGSWLLRETRWHTAPGA